MLDASKSILTIEYSPVLLLKKYQLGDEIEGYDGESLRNIALGQLGGRARVESRELKLENREL